MKKNTYKSKLKFNNYVVDSVWFKNNIKYKDEKGEGTHVDFDIKPEIVPFNDGTNFMVILDVDVFKDAEEKNYPFEMNIKLVGYFKVEGDKKDIDQYKSNAIAIMYPYIRSLVTSYTANANVTPLILPVINVNAMISDKEKIRKNNDNL